MAEVAGQAEAGPADVASDDVEPLSWKVYALIGGLWFLVMQSLSWLGVSSDEPYLWVAAVFFFGLGGLCWANGRSCGAIHCRISGPGYAAIGLAAVLSALGVFALSMEVLMGAFLAIAIISYGIEVAFERSGSDRGRES